MDVVRRIYEGWERGESARPHLADDVEYINPSYAVEPGVSRGPKAFALVGETYEDFQLRVERLIDAGDGEVVALTRYEGSGRGSRVPVAGELGHVWTIRDGRATRFRWFRTHREALEAAGLS